MGKRSKKKIMQTASPGSKGSGPSSSSCSSTPITSSTVSPSESGRSVEIGGAGVDYSSRRCPHGPNIEKLQTQLAKLAAINCQDCTKLRSAVSAGKEQRKGVKGGKVVRRKQLPPSPGLGGEKKSNHNLWICLYCGQVGCGEETLKSGGEVSKHVLKQEIVGRGHAWQHWLQLKHPLVMLCGEEFSCWCFLCEIAHKVGEVKHNEDVSSETETHVCLESEGEASLPPCRDMLLQQVATLIREKFSAELAVVKEDSKGDAIEASEDAEKPHSPMGLENGSFHEKSEAPTYTITNARVMKGLVNLGNTCFFNSVMQNLLSVELLRNHFGPGSTLPEGPLISALKKFFLEASFLSPSEANSQLQEVGLRKNAKGARGGWSSIDGTYNPKGLFGAICSKVPRFKGFQQQDSHELLRCLLDGLHTEEEHSLKSSLKLNSGGGEDALRALSESDGRNNGRNMEVDGVEDSGFPRQDAEGTTEKDVCKQKSSVRQETFVESAFGGQLSSTVSCCKCGHSSVVYESFLDLSLPIPSKKQTSKKASALANGSSITQSKTQKVLKNLKAKAKGDSNLEAFRLTPAGLGTPLLLLPAPPPKDNNGDSTSTEVKCDWLDYIDAGTGSDEPDWLGFLSDEGVGPEPISGCAPNPDSQTIQDTAPDFESDFLFGCAPNPDLVQQSSECEGILSSPVCQSACSIEFQDRHHGEGADSCSSSDANMASQSLDASLGGSFVLLEAAEEAIAESKNASTVGCGSGLRPLRGQEMDLPIQMRGGSETNTFNAAQEAELDSCPVSEPLSDTNFRANRSGYYNDDSSSQSDIISRPNGSTVILLGPPVDNGSASDFLNVELEGEYIGSLFEEEDSNEDKVYGPLPLNQSRGASQESSYDGIVFDDVLDLSKISCEETGNWLVSNEEGQGEETTETPMSLEGCLQTFTRSELLSGENAWACENCTKKYYEGLARDEKLTAVPEKLSTESSISKDGSEFCSDGSSKDPSIGDSINCTKKYHEGLARDEKSTAVPEKLLTESSVTKDGSEYCSDGSSKYPSIGDSILRDSHEDAQLAINGCAAGNEKLEDIESSSIVETIELEPSVSFEINCHVDGRENNACSDKKVVEVLEACPEGQLDNAETAGTSSRQSSYEPVDLLSPVTRSEPEAESNPSDEARTLVAPDMLNSSGVVAQEVENEKKSSQGITRKTSKLKKSQSKKVREEQKKVIKQDATKRFLISRAPPVLTIQLKRFAQDMRGRLSKLSGHVAFQETLDLHPFLDHRHVNFDCKYRLIGTVEHSGTLKSGHYVSFVRGPSAQNSRNDTKTTSVGASSWYYISDSHVHQTNLDAVLRSEAYLVFYERVDTTEESRSK